MEGVQALSCVPDVWIPTLNLPLSWGNKGDDRDSDFKSSLSVQFSHSVMSNSLQPHGLQHARSPCPTPTPGVYSNSCPWVGDAIKPSHPLSSLSPPAFNLSQQQGFFQWVDSFASGGQSILSFSFSISPSSEYSVLISFRIDWLDLLAVQQTLKSLLQHSVSKYQFFGAQPSLWSNCHIHTWLLEKP